MEAVSTKRKPAELSNGSSDEEVALAPAPVAQKITPVKNVKPDASRKRRTSAQASPSVQKNTLDNWFGIAKKTPPAKTTKAESARNPKAVTENDEADDMEVDVSPVVHTPTASKFFKRTSPSKTKGAGKKLVQRRILLSDQCRVCESSKTESSMRCERKCMECELTVHMSCYGVDDDDEVLPEKWRCRPCQAMFDLTEEKPEADGDSSDDDVTTTTANGIPVHEPRGQDNRFHGLYHSSDFAAVFLFLKRFRRLGLKLGADITIDTLAAALLSPRDHTLLSELHTRLLQNIGATISKNGNWVDNVMRFLKTSDYAIGGELVRRLAACGNANDWLETYHDVPVADRVAILKVLCEAQFDENDALVEKLGDADTAPESLREDELGIDAAKRTYYLLEDPSNFSQGSAWLCRCQSLDGSNWETVADDLSSLQSFARALSYSTETLNLRLWQVIVNGVAKSLERREKKKLQQAQRLARMPRMLRSSGLDVASILPEDGPSSAGRSLRTRRAVSYRTYESEDEDEEEDEEEEEDDGEDDDDDDDGGDSAGDEDEPSRKRRRVDRIERPTRSSRRLHRGSPRRDEESDVSEEDKDEEESGGAGEKNADGESGDSA